VRLFAVVEYDGTDFAGFQYQEREQVQLRTVQGELERAISACTGETPRVSGAGRTDAGVHASGQVVHFDSEAKIARDPSRLARALNAHLPEDLKVRSMAGVPADHHSRFSASRRRYCYRIYNSRQPSPLHRRFTHHARVPLDAERMNEGAQLLVGSHDFVAFAAEQGPGSTVRRVFSARVARTWAGGSPIWHTYEVAACDSAALALDQDDAQAQLIEIEVEANGFLRHMMRRIAGTLIRAGDGRLAPGDVATILASRVKSQAGPTAPARGLCLEAVTY